MKAKEMFKKLYCQYEEDEVFVSIVHSYYDISFNKEKGEMFITFIDPKNDRSLVTALHKDTLKAFGTLIKEQGWLDE